MKDPEIKSNTVLPADIKEPLPSDIEESQQMDALLHFAADECNSKVDFAAIHQRVLDSDRKRKNRRKLFLRISAAAAACVMLVGLSVIIKESMMLASDKMPPQKGESAPVPGEPPVSSDISGDMHMGSAIQGYDSCEYIGVLDSESDSVEHVYAVFNKDLPSYMKNQYDRGSNTFTAEGKDASGHNKYCTCAVVSAPPYKLEPGQLGKIPFYGGRYSDTLEFFWQINRDSCLKISFSGFDENEAQLLIDHITIYQSR